MEIGKISDNVVKSVATGELDANSVRLVGVGVEEFGVEDFVKGQFFSGDLFIDTKKQCYKDLGFKRFNFFSIFPVIFAKTTRDAMNKAKQEKIDGNMRGDGFQNGGLIIVQAGGKLLLHYKQEDPGVHLENSKILEALGMKEATTSTPPEEGATGG